MLLTSNTTTLLDICNIHMDTESSHQFTSMVAENSYPYLKWLQELSIQLLQTYKYFH